MSGFSVPDSLRRTIQDIKEIAGKHSDEDVYAMLKECRMDPNETAQKLLYLDTFHEVKKKRSRRKASVNNRASQEYRRIPGMQWQGTRDNKTDGRQSNNRQEKGYTSSVERASKSSTPLHHKENNELPVVASSTDSANGSTSICNISYINESTYPLAEHDIRGTIKDTKPEYGNKSGKSSPLHHVVVKKLPTLDPGPTPTPTPTSTSSTVATRSRTQGRSFKPKYSHFEDNVGTTSASGMYSSALDPVLVPSLNPRNPGAVGTIKRETGSVEQVNGPSKEILSEAAGIVSRDLPTLGDPCLEQVASEVDIELDISARQSVIFPNHLRVPEAYKNTLTFGSLDASLGHNSKDSIPKDESVPTNTNTSKESSPNPKSSSQSPPHVIVNITSPQENCLSIGTAPRYEQEIRTRIPEYGPSLLQPVVGSHLLPPQGFDPQGVNLLIPSTTSSTHLGIAQSSSSIALPPPPQLFPYPPNYIPYNPYFSQLYMPPQNAHHGSFLHQPPPGNIFVPPTPAYKAGHIPRISSAYGSYGSSYGSSAAGLPPGTSNNDDIAGSDTNMYSAIKQNTDLQANVYYNPQQGQHVGHNSFHGMYHHHQHHHHPAQSMSHRIGGAVDSILPPYPQLQLQQQQTQLLPLPQQQYGQTYWNKKFIE